MEGQAVPPTPMRAPVEGPGSWALESALDELAVKLELDPLDRRLANCAEEHPMEGRPWSSKKLREAYQEADEAYGWCTRAERPREDGNWAIGHGLGGAGMFCARFANTARVRVHGSGRVTVESGSNDIGTGSQTGLRARGGRGAWQIARPGRRAMGRQQPAPPTTPSPGDRST